MKLDWVQALKPLTERKAWDWGVDGKYRLWKYTQPSDTPWAHGNGHIEGSREQGYDCGLLTIYHNFVFGHKAVHSFCMNCYKVVVVPETLEHVHKIYDWQQSLDWPCKVGAEVRNYTQRKWGAYFYCRGVEKGKERYKEVRKWVDENLGENIKVFLKRGCTEFEQNLGDSDKWDDIPFEEIFGFPQEEIEAEGKEVIDYQPMINEQPDVIKHHVFNYWDQWDKMNQAPVTYHDEENSDGR